MKSISIILSLLCVLSLVAVLQADFCSENNNANAATCELTVDGSGKPLLILTDINQGFTGSSGWVIDPQFNDDPKTTCDGVEMLGGYNKFGAGFIIRKNFIPLPPHFSYDLAITAFIMDSWDDESFYIYQNEETIIFLQAYNWGNYPGYNCDPNEGFPDTSQAISVVDQINSQPDRLHLHISSTLNQDATDESWGVAELKLTFRLCPAHCTSCSNFDTCNSCDQTTYKSSSACVTNCPVGTWSSSNTRTCEPNEGRLTISGSHEIKQCDSVDLTANVNANEDPQVSSITWSVTYQTSNAALRTQLNNYLASQTSRNLVVDPTLLEFKAYTFHASYTHDGSTASADFQVVNSVKEFIQINGASTIQVCPKKPFTLTAQIVSPTCDGFDPSYTVQWSQVSGPTIRKTNLSGANTLILNILKNSLTNGKHYVLKVTATLTAYSLTTSDQRELVGNGKNC